MRPNIYFFLLKIVNFLNKVTYIVGNTYIIVYILVCFIIIKKFTKIKINSRL